MYRRGNIPQSKVKTTLDEWVPLSAMLSGFLLALFAVAFLIGRSQPQPSVKHPNSHVWSFQEQPLSGSSRLLSQSLATVGLHSLLHNFYDGVNATIYRHPLSENDTRNNFEPATIWEDAQIWHTFIQGLYLVPSLLPPGMQQFDLRQISQQIFRRKDQEQSWISEYYDDMLWECLTLLAAIAAKERHLLPADDPSDYVGRLQWLYERVQQGWDDSCCFPGAGGGIWWNAQHTQKATASNGGAVVVGVALAGITGNASYGHFAARVYNYWWKHMVDPATFHVADHVTASGAVVQWKFTYNEAIMIGACLAMHELSQNPRYLARAARIAEFVLVNETDEWAESERVLRDTPPCQGDCQLFKGVAFRYLTKFIHAVRFADLSSLSKTEQAHVVRVAADTQSLRRTSACAIWANRVEKEKTRHQLDVRFGTSWTAADTEYANVSVRQQMSAVEALCRTNTELGTSDRSRTFWD